MDPQVKSDRDMVSSTMWALSLYLCQTLHITNKDHESVPANAHLGEIATVVQIQILKKKQDVLDFDL